MRKTKENNQLRLQHMLDAANHARNFTEGKNSSALDNDLQFQFALTRAVEIGCDAACNITAEYHVYYAVDSMEANYGHATSGWLMPNISSTAMNFGRQ